jgi:uncharacterized membrane protein
MRRTRKYVSNPRRGQALVMVALAMTVMCGFLALAVDLGLAYSIRKSAQAAADSAALAGAGNALGSGVYVACGPGPSCGPSTDSAYLYASKNGFSNSSNNGYAQTVSVQSGITVPWPSETGVVSTNYWVMVVASEQIPQFFSGIFGNTPIIVKVSSVAAIVQVEGHATVALVQ